jgi:hypothetical protein
MIERVMMATRLRRLLHGPKILVGALLLTMTACRGGCRRDEAARPDPLLALFPADAQVFLSLDFKRIRETGFWKQLEAEVGEDAEDKRLVEELTRATGINPFTQIHRLVAAFPEEARRSHAFGVVIEGERIDRARLLSYLKSEAAQGGGAPLVERAHKRFTLWGSPAPDAPAGFFLDDTHFVLGSGGWTEKMADRAPAPAAPAAVAPAVPPALLRLIDRAARGRSIWLAAVVPEATRAQLMKDQRFGAEASVMRFGGGLDLGPDLGGDFVAEMASAADAQAMVAKVTTFLSAAKKSPEVLLLGVAPYLDGVKVEADGPNARIHVNLPRAQAEELTARLMGLLRLRRAGR